MSAGAPGGRGSGGGLGSNATPGGISGHGQGEGGTGYGGGYSQEGVWGYGKENQAGFGTDSFNGIWGAHDYGLPKVSGLGYPMSSYVDPTMGMMRMAWGEPEETQGFWNSINYHALSALESAKENFGSITGAVLGFATGNPAVGFLGKLAGDAFKGWLKGETMSEAMGPAVVSAVPSMLGGPAFGQIGEKFGGPIASAALSPLGNVVGAKVAKEMRNADWSNRIGPTIENERALSGNNMDIVNYLARLQAERNQWQA